VPRRLAHPTLLVPGFATGNIQFLPFRSWLRRHGVDARTWPEAPLLYRRRPEEDAERFACHVLMQEEDDLAVVTWSYGVVPALGAMAIYPEAAAKTRVVVSFAPPIDGTWAAYPGQAADLFGLHVRAMLPNSPFLRDLRRLIADRERPWRFHAINGRHDLLTPAPQRTVPRDLRIEGPWNHLSLLYDRRLFRLIHRLITEP
jgi:hypothetical protein